MPLEVEVPSSTAHWAYSYQNFPDYLAFMVRDIFCMPRIGVTNWWGYLLSPYHILIRLDSFMADVYHLFLGVLKTILIEAFLHLTQVTKPKLPFCGGRKILPHFSLWMWSL